MSKFTTAILIVALVAAWCMDAGRAQAGWRTSSSDKKQTSSQTSSSGEKKGFWSKVGDKFKKDKPATSTSSAPGQEKPKDASGAVPAKSETDFLVLNDKKRDYLRALPSMWGLDVGKPLLKTAWIGHTFKKVPYSEEEYVALKEKLITDELNSRKRMYVQKKKAALGGEAEETEKDVSNLLENMLAGEDNVMVEKEKADLDSDKVFLEDFDEEEARRQILERLVVPQARSIQARAVYFQTQDNHLYCVELESGLTDWILALPSPLSAPMHETRDTLQFVMDGYLYVVEKESGLVLHRSMLDRATQPVVFSRRDVFFVASYRRRVIQWDPDKNFPVWSHLLSGEISNGVYGNDENLMLPQENGELTAIGFDGEVKWTFVNKGVAEDRLYLERELRDTLAKIAKEQSEAEKEDRQPDKNAIRIQEQIADDIEKRIEILSSRVRGRFLSAPVTKGDSVYVGSTDFNLYKLNRYTGIPDWQYTCRSQVVQEAHVDESKVWVLDMVGVLHGLDVKSGKRTDVEEGVTQLIRAGQNLVFYRNSVGQVMVHTRLGSAAIDGLEGRSALVAEEMDILFGFQPGSSVITTYDLSAVRR